MKRYKVGQKVKVFVDQGWLPGTVTSEWNRPASFRTDANPEAGGPVVNVPSAPYREKTFQATFDQVRQ